MDERREENGGEKSEHLTDWYRKGNRRNAPPLNLVESLELGNGDEAVKRNESMSVIVLYAERADLAAYVFGHPHNNSLSATVDIDLLSGRDL